MESFGEIISEKRIKRCKFCGVPSSSYDPITGDIICSRICFEKLGHDSILKEIKDAIEKEEKYIWK